MRRPTRDRLLLPAALALTGALASCGTDRELTPYDDAYCAKAMSEPESVNAFDWLKDPYGGPKRFGGWSTDQGLALAHELERRGAKRLAAVGVRRVQGAEPSQRAAGLVVELPDDPAGRRAVFALYAKQVRDEGFAPQPDAGQKYLYFAWDH